MNPAMDKHFLDKRIITFDCYGTLIDWETGILDALRQSIGLRAGEEGRALDLYSRIEPEIQANGYKRYREVLREVLARLAAELERSIPAGKEDAIAFSIRNWLPFPDTVDALRRLKAKYQLGIISNIDDDLFAQTAQHLQVPFDLIVTAQQAGAYKPSHKNFETAERVGKLDRKTWLHAAESLFHDIVPSHALGISSVWVNRRQGKANAATRIADVRPDVEVRSLKDLADIAGV
jgi:2-haloacid dehalogenase